jgi:HD-like signal output (HDOD) protein/CheY-like chemotaxis protein
MKSILFVDDEPGALSQLQSQLSPLGQGCQMRFASGGVHALQVLAQGPVDVIVTDLMMPGMDGAQLLEVVRKRHPSIIRIAFSTASERETNLRLVGPAHQCLPKSCNPDELQDTIARAFALRELLTNAQLKELICRMETLPSLPSLYLELTSELRSNDPSMERIGEIIARDIAMSAKILQLVNSAFFGLAHRVTHPAEAALYLGIETVSSLVLSLQIFSQYNRYQAQLPEFSIETLWQHCWNTGARARRIARSEHFDAETANHCFVGGLLHDLGKLILLATLPGPFREALHRAAADKSPLWRHEKELLGSTHAEIGAYLLGLWNFPTALIETVALHHRPGTGLHPDLDSVAVAYVANVFDHELSMAEHPGADPNLDHDYLRLVGAEDHLPEWSDLCMMSGSSDD